MNKENGYSVLLVSASEKFNESLSSLMPRETYDPILNIESVSAARRLVKERDFDIIIINAPLKDETGINFAIDITETTTSGVLLLVKTEFFDEISDKVQPYGVCTVSKPVTKPIMTQYLKILCSTRERLFKLEKKQHTFEEKIEEIKLVNRAKLLLMENMLMSEEDAHKFIEKNAMNHRKSRREIAEELIKKYAD